MRKILILVLCIFALAACQQSVNSEAEVKQVIEKYFEAFNTHSLAANDEITTEDWYHINPSGGWNRGRAETVKLLRDVHSTFLKDVKMKLEDLDIRFATPDVAVVTVMNSIDNYTLPNGEKHENEQQIKTIVVVRRDGKWRIIQDQNTIIK
ncbi:MAG TPA: SgcJ/EcaC family oxidoreductase [Pyrinomonadaceae bacterium]|nr:SgcJ/EcaC family oxidoreductase [Pyrinomonadaceae bacterium]